MENLKKILDDLGIPEALKADIIQKVKGETDPQKVKNIISDVLDREEARLDEEERKLDADLQKTDQQELDEQKELERELDVALQTLEEEAMEVKSSTIKQLEAIKVDELKADLSKGA